jgi:hypothetical protein
MASGTKSMSKQRRLLPKPDGESRHECDVVDYQNQLSLVVRNLAVFKCSDVLTFLERVLAAYD